MKNNRLRHHYESAKIYRHYYKPTFNFWRLLKSVLALIISGSSHVATSHHNKK